MTSRSGIAVFFGFVLLLTGLLYLYEQGTTVSVQHEASQVTENQVATSTETMAHPATNPLTGEVCDYGDSRPLAVMLEADTVARPLTGVAQADVVVEMPVLTNGITRYMALFSCERPQEIGTIRSARDDFLPFVRSFDAIYAHWGGSYLALDILKTGVIDNIDSLINPFDAFYRKDALPAPHNGFTSFDRLETAAEKLNFRTTPSQAKSFVHVKDGVLLNADQNISIAYPRPYDVSFTYNHATNTYKRWRDGTEEMDAGNNKQVEVKNVVVMVAPSVQVNADYNDVGVTGLGDVTIYRNGEVVQGKWQRAPETYTTGSQGDNAYHFVDTAGQEIGFVPGKIWISIVQPNQRVELTFK